MPVLHLKWLYFTAHLLFYVSRRLKLLLLLSFISVNDDIDLNVF